MHIKNTDSNWPTKDHLIHSPNSHHPHKIKNPKFKSSYSSFILHSQPTISNPLPLLQSHGHGSSSNPLHPISLHPQIHRHYRPMEAIPNSLLPQLQAPQARLLFPLTQGLCRSRSPGGPGRGSCRILPTRARPNHPFPNLRRQYRGTAPEGPGGGILCHNMGVPQGANIRDADRWRGDYARRAESAEIG